jgi:hypothetical protein
MLAYLDNMLDDPSEAEELGKKIEESEFATGLVHRIRSVTNWPRLGTPSLEGRGVGLDPNTVAEYLNDELPPERVPDLEKVCLESDVHLAEVAACHQILALVLKEPVEIDPALRESIYRIGSPDAPQRVQRAAAQFQPDVRGREGAADEPPLGAAEVEPFPPPATMVPPPPQAESVAPRHRKPFEVPDYLRVGQRGKWKPLAITLLLAFLLSAVALRAMGPFDRDHPLMRLLGGKPSAEVTQASPETTQTPKPAGADSSLAPAAISKPAPSERAGTKGEPAPGIDAADRATEPTSPEAAGGPPPKPEGAGTAAPAVPASKPLDPAKPVAEPDARETTKPGGDAKEMLPAAEPKPDAAKVAAKPPAPSDVPPATPPASEAVPPVEVGYVKLSDPHFLVKYVPQSADWFRLPARSRLMSGDQLIVFPTYRPEIVLTPGVQVVLAGPSSVQTRPQNAQGEPELAMEYGRALIGTAGVAGARIHLELGGQRGTVTFQEAASEIGIEVSSYLPPGANPETDPTLPVVRIYTTIGRIEWQGADSQTPLPVEQGQVRIIIGDQSQTNVVAQSPAWMQRTELRDVDRLASDTLEPLVVEDRPVSLILKERGADRKSELRSLAARCLAYLDSFEALVKEFGDDRQRAYWTSEFDVLRQSLSRSPESAAKVRKVLESYCGADAANLYRLSWGYSPEQLGQGGDRELVEFLDHDSLAVRVFAFENLQRITNKTLYYLPWSNDRKSSLQSWKKQLQSGAVLYESLPSPLQSGG